MKTFEYINPLIQHGKAEYDLIITDDSDPSFYVRIGKKFKDTVTVEEMNAVALDTIANLEVEE